MVARSFQLFILLGVALLGLHLVSGHAHFGDSLSSAVYSPSSTLPPPVIPPVRALEAPPPLEQPPIVEQSPPKKHFWQRAKPTAETDANEALETTEETIAEQRPRSRFGLSLPNAHFNGVKLILWESGCPLGEKALRAAENYCRHHACTIGDGPQCDVWVIRVPHDSEPRCPRWEFYFDGRHIPPDMTGFAGPGQLKFIFARLPRCSPDWYREQPETPPQRGGTNWGPGVGIRYKSDTDVGLGLGFGSGWAPACSGN